MRDNYSYAGPTRGLSDPEETEIYEITDSENKPNRLMESSADSTVIQWEGGEYSRRRTWIMAVDADVVNLEEQR